MAKSRRAKKQIKEIDPKMGYFRGPNKALTKSGFLKDQSWSHLGRKEKREREGEEKRKRKRRSSQDQEVWNLDFWYENQP